jgi:hypothetical protein
VIDRVEDPKKAEALTLKAAENLVAWRWDMMERRKRMRVWVRLPFKYWQTDDACHGGLVGNLSETGLLIYSIKHMPVATDLSIRFFSITGMNLIPSK